MLTSSLKAASDQTPKAGPEIQTPHPAHRASPSITLDFFLIYENLSSEFKSTGSLPKEVRSLYTLSENFPTRGNSTNTQMTSPRKGSCSPRAQPPWKMTRVRDRESWGHLSDLASGDQQLVSWLISPALCSRPALTGQGRGKRLWLAFLFLLTKPSAIGLPWLGARPARLCLPVRYHDNGDALLPRQQLVDG